MTKINGATFCAALVLASVASSTAFAQSAEETAAFLYSGVVANDENPNEERISEQPLTFREWLDKAKGQIIKDTTFEQIDGCRFRLTSKYYTETSNVLDVSVDVLDFSKTFYPPTVVESGPYRGVYQPRWYPGAWCSIQEDGSTKCNTETDRPGIDRELSRIQAAVKYMNDKFCKTRAF
ncbi:hypothetical protein [Rhizobium sp. RAF56]|uniref:hypothetical protein n=1 Tax=Rhizobium sp. RAF56 TaxID=3233062 RepID=UPI003F976DB6